MSRVIYVFGIVVASAFLQGCPQHIPETVVNKSPANSERTVSGVVADGYIQGAKVFWDCNSNNALDIDETFVITVKGGKYSIPYKEGCMLLAYVPSGAYDETWDVEIVKPVTLAAAGGNYQFISPLTTLVAGEISSGKSEVDAINSIKNQLDLELDPTVNYVEKLATPGGLKNANTAVVVLTRQQSISTTTPTLHQLNRLVSDVAEIKSKILSEVVTHGSLMSIAAEMKPYEETGTSSPSPVGVAMSKYYISTKETVDQAVDCSIQKSAQELAALGAMDEYGNWDLTRLSYFNINRYKINIRGLVPEAPEVSNIRSLLTNSMWLVDDEYNRKISPYTSASAWFFAGSSSEWLQLGAKTLGNVASGAVNIAIAGSLAQSGLYAACGTPLDWRRVVGRTYNIGLRKHHDLLKDLLGLLDLAATDSSYLIDGLPRLLNGEMSEVEAKSYLAKASSAAGKIIKYGLNKAGCSGCDALGNIFDTAGTEFNVAVNPERFGNNIKIIKTAAEFLKGITQSFGCTAFTSSLEVVIAFADTVDFSVELRDKQWRTIETLITQMTIERRKMDQDLLRYASIGELQYYLNKYVQVTPKNIGAEFGVPLERALAGGVGTIADPILKSCGSDVDVGGSTGGGTGSGGTDTVGSGGGR